MNTDQAEAGPSTPRTLTPPSTPPAKNASRRRSWFGFVGSPFGAPSVSAIQASESPRRKSYAVEGDGGGEEGHELVDRSQADTKDPGTPASVVRRSSLQVVHDEKQEVLTIDGQLESASVRRKKKGRSRGVDEEHGEVVRLDDLTFGRKGSLKRDPMPVEVEVHSDLTMPKTTPPKVQKSPPPPLNLKCSPPKPSRSRISNPIPPAARSSSLSIPPVWVPPDKSTPILPTDRPLPALPSESPASPPSTAPLPTNIVITPSSPRKLHKPRSPHARRTSSSMMDLRAARNIHGDKNGRPHTSSGGKAKEKTISRKSSMIGLGLPRGMNGYEAGEMLPPPVPHKTQSVSSPNPSRSSSPVPKISFAEPGEGEGRGRSEKLGEDEKKDKGKRARSLSGIFTRSVSQPVPSKAGSVVSGGEQQVEDGPGTEPEAEHAESGKMAGVLEWLGVKKPAKRRLSDARVVGMEHGGEGESQRDANGEEERDYEVDQTTLRADPFRRPELHGVSSSNTTLMPTSDASRIAQGETPPGPIAIPSRQSDNSSNVPEMTAPSPGPTGTPTSYVSSPTAKAEEMFFTPPNAPWVDGTDTPPRSAEPKAISAIAKDGRLRSWSDAPTPSPHIVPPQTGSPMEGSPDHTPPQPPSSSNLRPKLGNRSHSGNSAIIEKMKGVFTKSSRNRSRSKSLLPPANAGEGEVNEFGGLEGSQRLKNGSTASLSSSHYWSPGQVTNGSLLDLGSRQASIEDTTHESRRANGATHSTPTSAYTPQPTASTISERVPDSIPSVMKPARNRGRASTVSFASSSPQTSFLPPPPISSPGIFPVSGTPPRRRPSVIQRFSSGLLGSSAPSSPKGSLFPLPPRSSGSTFSSGGVSGNDDTLSMGTGATSLLLSPGASPRPSNGSGTGSASRSGWKSDIKVEAGETAEGWLDRMVASVGRDEIAGVLASSGDGFHSRALELYMTEFDFTHNALDVALRRLLMQISLPKETQQIDRVLEAFSKRYEVCEPGLFGSKDNTYVLAFSMMMLHTDAFNKNNKNKMTKADYVRNTRMDGVNPITLEAFYDNITYTPFVYFDMDADVPSGSHIMGGRSRSGSDAIAPTTPSSFVGSPSTPISIPNGSSTLTPSSISTLSTTPRRAPTPTASSTLSAKQPDVYALITQNNLHPLRVDVERSIPAESPFSCIGTRPFLEMGRTHNLFVEAGILRIGDSTSTGAAKKKAGSVGKKRGESDSEGKSVGGGESEVSLRVTKVGTLSRKDEPLDVSRKTSRKWKSWSVILSGSQLLFFKDPFWALSLQEQMKADSSTAKRDEKGQVMLPRVARFVPDEVFPVKDAVAVWDRTLTEHAHTFRFYLPNRSYLIQASDEREMNDWISLINYAAAFKTSAIRMRAGSMRKDQALLAGAAAASSLRRESKSLDAVGEEKTGRKRFGSLPHDVSDTPTPPMSIIGPPSIRGSSVNHYTPPSILSVRRSDDSQRQRARTPDRSDTSSPVSGKNARASVESESAGMVPRDEGERLGEVFRAVKAELASEPGLGLGLAGTGKTRAGLRVRIPSSQAVRATAIETAIRSLSAKVALAQSSLDISLIQARNLAILTPFQRTTRDQISSAVPPLAIKVRDDRVVIAKLELWISILQCDLDREEKEWEGTREVALRGAKKSLEGEAGVMGVAQDLTAALEVGEGSKVRFNIEEGGTEEEGGKETEEILTDTPGVGVNLNVNPLDNRHDESATLGSTPQELPILFRPSSDEAIQQLANVSPAGRPSMRRHVSASLL